MFVNSDWFVLKYYFKIQLYPQNGKHIEVYYILVKNLAVIYTAEFTLWNIWLRAVPEWLYMYM